MLELTKSVFTVKHHKHNFSNKVICRFFKPARTGMGLLAKIIQIFTNIRNRETTKVKNRIIQALPYIGLGM